MVVVPAVATFRKTIPSPRVCAGSRAPPWAARSYDVEFGRGRVERPPYVGALNGVNGVLETDWKPLSDTAIFGPSSSPHGCSRLRAGAITPDAICGRAGIAPVERDLIPRRVAISAPCSPAVVPLSVPPAAASKLAIALAVDVPEPVNVAGEPPVGTPSEAYAAGASAAHAQATATATAKSAQRTAPNINNARSDYSHSIVPGGLLVISSTTRPTGRISPIIRAAICSSRS